MNEYYQTYGFLGKRFKFSSITYSTTKLKFTSTLGSYLERIMMLLQRSSMMSFFWEYQSCRFFSFPYLIQFLEVPYNLFNVYYTVNVQITNIQVKSTFTISPDIMGRIYKLVIRLNELLFCIPHLFNFV